ncbi:MAG: hypothetical protein HOM68_02835 [Gemmatimonadetes bacterium]|jgi:hypothetical protein|nr:hypothetical protein [Gemmatimonadota bacterium]MBT5055453.1 hypothetical protein [Gemmatimonadota bacterium]MBT5143427.1 hypothetical protein [Gemmatimonadota bacterium]MBT5587760.1 hypothetical protein [Gemmatimonadota bacterium]MBT5963851.1 hypothetical protein [Gemmatimonadota bacterium]
MNTIIPIPFLALGFVVLVGTIAGATWLHTRNGPRLDVDNARRNCRQYHFSCVGCDHGDDSLRSAHAQILQLIYHWLNPTGSIHLALSN